MSNITNRYLSAKEIYAKRGIDTDAAIEKMLSIPISMHCWQGDDVVGFDQDGPLTGGIQATGNYPGKAKNPAQLMADIDKAFSLIPGKKKLNIHANYAIFEPGEHVDRNKIEPKHFKKWVDFAKERGIGLDFNPTFFSHKMADSGLTLSSPVKEVRDFWIEHGKACIRIAEYFAEELKQPCLVNFWIPDGYKDIPADRLSPRKRFAEAMDEILSIPYNKKSVAVSIESKVFGIGVESYTVGSSEFAVNYAMKNGILPLMDNGHYHPTEVVSDKISALLLFFDKIALHITRPVRWDSDHVVLFDDETREIAKEIIAHNAVDRVFIGLDYFDASINRIAAWTVGMRNAQKAFLYALLCPHEKLAALQESSRFTELMVLNEEMKTCPFGDIWEHYCELCGTPSDGEWFGYISDYEKNVLSTR